MHGLSTSSLGSRKVHLTKVLIPLIALSIDHQNHSKWHTWCHVRYTDKLIKRAWPCDPTCSLCDQEQETTAHLCLHCVFAQEVWYLMQVWSNGLVKKPERGVDIETWWRSSLQLLPKDQRRHVAALLMYTTWNIWKERNRRVFEKKTMTAPLVFNCILEEMGLWQAALRALSAT